MTDRPNIVLVTVDSLRADHCGFMGYGKDTTPTLDGMAENGVVFENAIAPGFATFGSMPAVFTGSSDYEVEDASMRERKREIADHMHLLPTLPERLSRRGYTTVGYTANPFTSRHFGFDRGFDRFEDFLSPEGSSRLRRYVVSRWTDGKFVAGLRFGLNMLGRGDTSISWEDYYGELLRSVSASDRPFLLWVFLLDPHWPYRPPGRDRNGVSAPEMYRQNWQRSPMSDGRPDDPEALRSLYDGAIRHVDRFVDRLTSDLGGADPVVVVHADHGEEFGEHGTYGHGALYEENVHVPLLVGNVDRHRRIEDPVSLSRLPSIVSDIADGGPTDWTDYTAPWVVSGTGDRRAVRGRDWKIVDTGEDVSFYELRSDPAEGSPTGGGERLRRLAHRLAAARRAEARERRLVSEAARDCTSERSL